MLVTHKTLKSLKTHTFQVTSQWEHPIFWGQPQKNY